MRIFQSHATAFFSFAALFWAPCVQAQDPSCLRRTILVNVRDPNWEQAKGLKAEDFRGEVRGQPIKILSVTPKSQTPRTVVVLDASGSMLYDEHSKWELARQLARDIFLAAPREREMALLVFAKQIDHRVTFGQDRREALRLLDALKPGKNAFPKGIRATAVHMAILEALTLLSPPRVGDLVYVITDADEDNASRVGRRQVEHALLNAGVRLFVLVETLRFRQGRLPESSDLQDIVKRSSGGYYRVFGTWYMRTEDFRYYETPEGRQAIGALLQRLYAEMTETYELELELPNEVQKLQDWKLGLVKNPARKGRFELSYPRRLKPCSTAPG